MRLATGSRLIPILLVVVVSITSCGVEGTRIPGPGPAVAGQQIPARGDLLVVGDWGSGTSSQEAVARAMADYAADHAISAVVTTGDNFYSDAAAELMEPYDWATDREIPFIIAWGNHDVETKSRVDAVETTFGDPPRWVSHEWGAVDIVILDSNTVGSPEQLDFLERTLSSSTDPTIVVFHHPPYTCGRHSPSHEVVEHWVSLFDDDVFLVLSGHDHNYQRFESSGVAYVVTGGGGRSRYELSECPPGHPDLMAGEATHHFLVVEQDKEIQVTAIDTNGETIDEFSLSLP